jgi:DNA repair exonuclease SbcCD nuclease subunit
MRRQLRQLRQIQIGANGSAADVPVLLVAGDIFDRWNPPAELINFALRELPQCVAVPGQHDLPNHNYSEMMRSGYGTLVEAGKIVNVNVPDDNEPFPVTAGAMLYGFPWGYEICPTSDPPYAVRIAVAHRMIWTKSTGYEGAPDDKHLSRYKEFLRGYDVAIFGDNHKPFVHRKWLSPYPTVVNCGGFFRRTVDQIDYVPHVYLIREDSSVEAVPLDVSQDVLIDSRKFMEREVAGRPMAEFLATLTGMKDTTISYEEAVARYMDANNVPAKVRRMVVAALGESK